MQPNDPLQLPEGISAAALNGFLQEYLADLENGSVRSLGEYQSRHPGAARAIPAELARFGAASRVADSGAVPLQAGAPGRLDAVGAEVGPYTLESELGRGGQGAVFLALDRRLGRRVALKLLLSPAAWSRVHLERFHREAALAARLDHPGLCTVYESNTHNGVPYVAMRHVVGETLAERLRRGSLPPEEAALIVELAARALAVAHAAGIVHRDVKPANLMLTPEDAVVVLDFGLAREVDDRGAGLTRTGDVFGTPAYMAPEQIDTGLGPCDARTDVWALGVTLAEALAGRPPFRAPTRVGLERAILSGALEIEVRLPRDLQVLLRTALAPERNQRYASAHDLAEDLRAWRTGRPIAARPAGAIGRLYRWAKRNRRLAAALGLAATLLLLGSAGTTYGWVRTRARERELALSKQEVEETAARALALNGYLSRMLEAPNPLRGLATARRDFTVGEMIDNASATLTTAFPGRPDLEAETRVSLGTTYSGLGRYGDARVQYAAALELYRGLHGDQHADVARVRRLHATTLGLLGDPDAAIPELEIALELSTRLRGEQHAEVAQAHTDLGWALLEAGQFERARAHSQSAVDWFRVSGAHAYELASATNNLAMSLRALGDPQAAERAYRDAIAAFQGLYGGESALAGAVTGNLAFLLAKEGRSQ